MICDMCGKDTTLFLAEIEGSELNVCEKCGKHGKIIRRIKTEQDVKEEKAVEQQYVPKGPNKETIMVIVDGYAEKIKNAREKRGLKQEDFAKKINEKQNLISHIESGKMEPSLALARKLERFLNIHLVDQETLVHGEPAKIDADSLTIGDTITIKKRKK